VSLPRGGNELALFTIAAMAVAAILIYALQAFWPTGIILMMLGAMVWVNVPIHGGLIALSLFSWRRRVPRAWLMLPAAFYAGGLVIFAASYLDAVDHRRAVLAMNARVTLPTVSPVTLFGGIGEQRFLRFFDVERLVLQDSVRWIVQGPVCEQDAGFSYERRSEPRIISKYYGPEGRRGGAKFCLAHQLFLGDRSIWTGYQIDTDSRAGQRSIFLSLDETAISLRVVGGTGAGPETIIDGAAYVTAPIPIFFAGCALISSRAKWACDLGVLKPISLPYYERPSGTLRFSSPNGADLEVARALSLQPRTSGATSLTPP